MDAGIEKGSDAFEKLDKTRAGVLIGSGMGGLTVFQDGVKNLVEKGHKKITPFFIPYAITNMCVGPTPASPDDNHKTPGCRPSLAPPDDSLKFLDADHQTVRIRPMQHMMRGSWLQH